MKKGKAKERDAKSNNCTYEFVFSRDRYVKKREIVNERGRRK